MRNGRFLLTAIPALLFKTVGGATVDAGAAGLLLAAFFGAVGATWLLAAAITPGRTQQS